MNIAIIGAGIFGLTISIKLSRRHNITIFEKNNDIMMEASRCNHNRIHFGFHYPRSIETSQQSLEGYLSFHENFKKSIVSNFPNYYLIEKSSKVKTEEYIDFCNHLNLNFKEEYPNLDVDYSNIESSFLTNEPIFDFTTIKKQIIEIIKENSNIKLKLSSEILSKELLDGYDIIINTTYSQSNYIKKIFNIEQQKMRLQDVVIPIFEFRKNRVGITIMDGEYCSMLPQGINANKFMLYHVKHSVLSQTDDYKMDKKYDDISEQINNIYLESENYFRFLSGVKRTSHCRTIRAVPINNDDSRLSDMSVNIVDNKKIINILSGKITTCFLIAKKIDEIL